MRIHSANVLKFYVELCWAAQGGLTLQQKGSSVTFCSVLTGCHPGDMSQTLGVFALSHDTLLSRNKDSRKASCLGAMGKRVCFKAFSRSTASYSLVLFLVNIWDLVLHNSKLC